MTRITDTVERLARHRELLAVLIDELHDLLNEPDDPANDRFLVEIVDQMLENLDRQFELEEQDGYLADVLDEYPNWHPQVKHLLEEHHMLHEHLRQIRDRLESQVRVRTAPTAIRRQLIDWIDAYRQHDRRETDLLQEAFTLEVGVGE